MALGSPVTDSSFPALIDAAKQQTELVCWVAKKLQEHEEKLEKLMAGGVSSPTAGRRTSGEGGSAGWASFREGRMSTIDKSRSAKLANTIMKMKSAAQKSGNSRPRTSSFFELPDDVGDGASSSPSRPATQTFGEEASPQPPASMPAADAPEARGLPSADGPAYKPEEAASARSSGARLDDEAEPPQARAGGDGGGGERELPSALAAPEGDSATQQDPSPANAAAAFASAFAAKKANKANARASDAEETAQAAMRAISAVELTASDAEEKAQEAMKATGQVIETISEEMDRRLEDMANFIQEELAHARQDIEAAIGSQVKQAALKAMEEALPEQLKKTKQELTELIDDKFSGGLLTSTGMERAISGDPEAIGQSVDGGNGAAPGSSAASEVAASAGAADGNDARSSIAGSPSPRVLPGRDSFGSDSEISKAARMLHAEMKKRLPVLEERVNEIKDLRLQIPDIRNDLDTLKNQVERLAQATEEQVAKYAKVAARSSEVKQQKSDGFSDSEGEDGGAPDGAHSKPLAVVGRSGSTGLGSSVGSYMKESRKGSAAESEETKKSLDEMQCRLEAFEKSVADRNKAKVADMDQLVGILEDRLKELDSEYRSHAAIADQRWEQVSAKMEAEKAEDAKLSKAWNLGNQVDIIQSLIIQEMRHVRSSVETLINKKLLGKEEGGRAPTKRKLGPEEEKDLGEVFEKVDDMEEKVRRLAECYQQCMLKIAGLKSATRHIETQATGAMDQVKKLGEEMEAITDRTAKHDVRLDYLSLHGRGNPAALSPQVGSATTFSGAIGWTEGAPAAPQTPAGGAKRRSSMAAGSQASSGAAPGSPMPKGRARRGSVSGVPQLQHKQTNPMENEEASQGAPGAGPDRQDNIDIQAEVNTGRILRLGKKVSDLDSEMLSQFKTIREDIFMYSHQVAQIIAFLPRRQRRVVEKIMGEAGKAKEDASAVAEEEKEMPKETKKSRLRFNDVIETKTYQVVEEGTLPWQLVGEPDQKWSWCYQSLNEMGRELARYLEQQEHERAEFEQDVQRALEQLQQDPRSGDGRPRQAATGPSPIPLATGSTRLPSRRAVAKEADESSHVPSREDLSATPDDAGAEKVSKRLEKAVIPQMAMFEERLDRLQHEMREHKRAQESNNQRKVDRDELQVLSARVSNLDKIDFRQWLARIEVLEQTGKHQEMILDQNTEQIRNVEAQMATRSEMTKVRSEIASLRTEIQNVQLELKNLSSSVYQSNRHTTSSLNKLKQQLEKQVTKLQDEKLGNKDFADMQERVHKLEHSMKDNRQILSDAGGSDINAVVKRIILNMEDKIMVLEKKVEALIEARTEAAGHASPSNAGGLSPSPSAVASRPGTSVQEMAAVNALGAEIESMASVVSQLKQDISISKVDMEQIHEQGHQHMELAQRLNVLVEGSLGESSEMGGTTALSLNRVQVMVSAAARQLVAGSKWITKETFDLRLGEFRKEYMSSSRQLQSQLEELTGLLASRVRFDAPSVGGPSATPSTQQLLPRMIVTRNNGSREADIVEWPETARDPMFDKAGGTKSALKDRPGTHLGAATAAVHSAGHPRSARGPGTGRPGTRG